LWLGSSPEILNWARPGLDQREGLGRQFDLGLLVATYNFEVLVCEFEHLLLVELLAILQHLLGQALQVNEEVVMLPSLLLLLQRSVVQELDWRMLPRIQTALGVI